MSRLHAVPAPPTEKPAILRVGGVGGDTGDRMTQMWRDVLASYAGQRLRPLRLEVLACYRAYNATGIATPSGVDITTISGIGGPDVTRSAQRLADEGLLERAHGRRYRYPSSPAKRAQIDAMLAT